MDNLDNLFGSAEKSLDQLLAGISALISEFADCQDFDTVSLLTKTASAVQAAKKLIVDEQKRPGLISPKGQNRSFVITVTEGALKYSYLNVTEGLRKGLLKIGDVIELEFPSGKAVSTTIVRGNRLQERGLIAKFFKEEHITEGDKVSMHEVTPGTWRLGKA